MNSGVYRNNVGVQSQPLIVGWIAIVKEGGTISISNANDERSNAPRLRLTTLYFAQGEMRKTWMYSRDRVSKNSRISVPRETRPPFLPPATQYLQYLKVCLSIITIVCNAPCTRMQDDAASFVTQCSIHLNTFGRFLCFRTAGRSVCNVYIKLIF